ncbi:MAG: choice-of-anchor J domain-containing protein [candidate division WOR-3 bacterium]
MKKMLGKTETRGGLMNRVLLILFILGNITFAQYFSESFNGPIFPPAGWTVYNLEDSTAPYDKSEWQQDGRGPRSQPGCAFCPKTYGGGQGGNPQVPNNDWLVTPRIYPTTTGYTLTFWYRGYTQNQKESLEVWVSRAGNTPQDFMNPATGYRVDAFSIKTWDYTLRTVSLASFINQPIYVAFRYCADNPNRHGVFIDDVGGTIRKPPLDVGVIEIKAPDTVITPTPFNPQAVVKNFGTEITSFKVKCYITRLPQGTQLYVDSLNIQSLLANGTGDAVFREITLSEGTYKVKFQTLNATYGKCHTGDMNPANDTMSRIFRVVAPTYRDVGVLSIIKPVGEVTEFPVYPKIIVKNYGSQAETFVTKLQIKNYQTQVVYLAETTIALPSLVSHEIEYRIPWNPQASVYPYEVVAFTMLPADQNRANDTARASTWIPQYDAKVIDITRPNIEIVEPTINLIPQARIANRSFITQTINIPSIFRIEKIGIGVVYSATASTQLGFCDDDTVNYTSWTTAPGRYKLICKTTLPGDNNPTNDSVVRTLFVPYRDVAPVYIEAPEDTIPHAGFIPRAVINNYSNYYINTPVELVIKYAGVPIWTDTNYVTVFDSVSGMVFFPEWQPPQTGTYEITFRTIFPYDLNPNNDEISKVFVVTSPTINISLVSIKSPTDTVQAGRTIYPRVRVKNNGNVPFTGSVTTDITNSTTKDIIYSSTAYISIPLMPNEERTIVFDPCNQITDPGEYYISSEVSVGGDIDTTDNRIGLSFRAFQNVYRDVGVARISEPTGRKSIGFLPTQVVIHNFGNTTEEFIVQLKIYPRNQSFPVYVSEATVELPRRTSQIIYFPNWAANTGTYTVRCTVLLDGDQQVSNNHRDTTVTVTEVQDYGWSSLAPISQTYRVKDGGALTYVPQKGIYAFVGNKTNLFYHYNIENNTWTPKRSLPNGLFVGNGASLCNDGENNIYAIVGNKTTKFLMYNIARDTWNELQDVPLRAPNSKKEVKIAGGAGLAYVKSENGDYVYLVKGNNTTQFFRYKIAADTWDTLVAQIPLGPTGKAKVKDGSAITTDGQYFIYLVKGGTVSEFYLYNVSSDTWINLDGIPTTFPNAKKIGKGTALAYTITNFVPQIYALKGNSYEFWRYNIQTNSWRACDNIINSPAYNKKVGAGAALTAVDGTIYALKGNNTPDFFKYKPNPNMNDENILSLHTQKAITTEKTTELGQVSLNLNSNIVSTTLKINYTTTTATSLITKLYTINGQLVASFSSELTPANNSVLTINLPKLPAGIYFVKLDADNKALTEKVIIKK